jgi:hypothetical protein
VTWARENVAVLERQPRYGGLHLVGVIVERHCGCQARLGLRLDRNEKTFSAAACEQHGVHVHRAMDALKHMPPQDEEIFALFERLVERELEAVPA